MEPGLHMTIPRRTSSRFSPRTKAPRLSPASARSSCLWNISTPEADGVRYPFFKKTHLTDWPKELATQLKVSWQNITVKQKDPKSTLFSFSAPIPLSLKGKVLAFSRCLKIYPKRMLPFRKCLFTFVTYGVKTRGSRTWNATLAIWLEMYTYCWGISPKGRLAQ